MRRSVVPAALVGILALWSVVPLVALALRASARGEWFSGADAPTMIDQLQYFAWIRDASDHFLAANLFRIGPSGRVFVDPMFLVSAGFHRLGLSVALAYLVWLPVAAAVFALGPYAYARARLGDPWAAAAAALIGLFFVGPHFLAAHWSGVIPAAGDATLRQAAATLFPGVMLLGGLPFAIALGLVPVTLLLAERRRAPAAAAIALIVTWIHPWQGEQIALACVGAFALRRRGRRDLDLLVPVLAVALPLAYFGLLAHFDHDWAIARRQAQGVHVAAWAWLVVIAPLAALAAVGIRDPRISRGEALLVTWPLACVVAFLVGPAVPGHALVGISIPLAVLAVRGWLRLRWPRWAAVAIAGALGVAASVYTGQALNTTVTSGLQPYSIPRADRAALAYLAAEPRPGGVLARPYAGSLVRALTGRQTWVGHASWTPQFYSRALLAEQLMTGSPPPAKARAFVRATHARLVLADCRSTRRVETLLAPLVVEVRRFGCARVLRLS